jgi:multiple sugar transport system ATP-binding protein
MKVLLQHVSKHFGTAKAVDDVTIEIKDGMLTGLLGPSGCGKSTTLYLISGLEKPTSGKIFFDDEDVTELEPEERGIGLVFQNYALYPHMSVLQNIMFPLENLKVPKKEAKERALEMAKLTRVDTLVERRPSQLSGGQQQRVAIARALVKKPKVLLLDEPLSNLDARLRIEMREEIRRIQQETGVTTIFVTHDQEEALNITDEIVLMKDGRFLQQCPPQEMYVKPKTLFVASFLGNPPINIVPVIIRNNSILFEDQKPYEIDSIGDGEYNLGLRAEWFIDGNDIIATINDVGIHGRDQIITFMLNGRPIQAVTDSMRHLQKGMRIGLGIRNRMVYVFDKTSGEQLRRID